MVNKDLGVEMDSCPLALYRLEPDSIPLVHLVLDREGRLGPMGGSYRLAEAGVQAEQAAIQIGTTYVLLVATATTTTCSCNGVWGFPHNAIQLSKYLNCNSELLLHIDSFYQPLPQPLNFSKNRLVVQLDVLLRTLSTQLHRSTIEPQTDLELPLLHC